MKFKLEHVTDILNSHVIIIYDANLLAWKNRVLPLEWASVASVLVYYVVEVSSIFNNSSVC